MARRVALRLLRSDQYRSRLLRDLYAKWYGVRVGLYSYGCFDPARFRAGIEIGRYCSFAPSSAVFTRNHPFDRLSTHPFTYDPSFKAVDRVTLASGSCLIEDDVWMGHGSVVLPSVGRLGRGCIVGAGAVVTKDVERYSIVAGNPARIIGFRYEDRIIEEVENSRWWTLDVEILSRVAPEIPYAVLSRDVSFLKRIEAVTRSV